MQFAIQQLSRQVLNPTTDTKRAVKQLIRYLKRTWQNFVFRFEPHMTVQKDVLELVGRSGSDSATRQSVAGCATYKEWRCATEVVPVRAKQSSAQPVHAQENFWVSFQFVSRWVQIRHVTSLSEEDHANSSTWKDGAWLFKNGSEKNVDRWDV